MKNFILPVLLALTTIIISGACRVNKIEKNPLKDKTDMYKILHYASLAGSSHNSQPWKAELVSDDSILVFADNARLLDVVDPGGVEQYISVGAFIENLDIAANALGYKTNMQLIENAINSSLPAVSIKFTKTMLPQHPEYLKDLELRTTLRIPFSTKQLTARHVAELLSLAPEEIAFVPSNSTEGRFIAEKELEAYTIQAFQKDAQDELASWMRFSNKDVNTKRDGLTPAGMGIKGIGGFVVRNFMKPEDSKKESFIKTGIEKTKKQVENCGGWLIISTANDGIADWLNAGRIYERLNIQCRHLSLGFHPMNQIIEVPEISRQFSEKMDTTRRIVFIARIGYVDEYPAPVSKRRPVESFTNNRQN